MQGFERSQISTERFLNLRYHGTDVAVMTPEPPAGAGAGEGGGGPAAYGEAFEAAYRREFGFVLQRDVWVDDVRVRAVGRARPLPDEGSAEAAPPGGCGRVPGWVLLESWTPHAFVCAPVVGQLCAEWRLVWVPVPLHQPAPCRTIPIHPTPL